MRFADLFVATTVLDGGPSAAKPDLVRDLLARLAHEGHIQTADVPTIHANVMRREKLCTTGIGQGIAIPHARHDGLSRRIGMLALCREPVNFDSLDGEPVDLVILLLSPPDPPWMHLGQASRWAETLWRSLREQEFVGRLRRATSPEELWLALRTADR